VVFGHPLASGIAAFDPLHKEFEPIAETFDPSCAIGLPRPASPWHAIRPRFRSSIRWTDADGRPRTPPRLRSPRWFVTKRRVVITMAPTPASLVAWAK
jgi:hypothetical protein